MGREHNPPMFLDPSEFVAGPDLLRALWQRAVSLDCSKDRELFRQGHKPSGLFILNCGDATMTLENDSGARGRRGASAPRRLREAIQVCAKQFARDA